MYYLNDPDLSYFFSNAQLDTEPQNVNLIYSFLNDMKCNINYADKKSKGYCFIKDLINQYIYQHIPYQLSQLGSGLNFTPGRSKSLICTDQRPANPALYVFLPSDPDELVDQLKLLYFGKVGENDNPMLSEQIIAIADKLLQYQCITTNQHQNLISTFLKRISLWIKHLEIRIRFITYHIFFYHFYLLAYLLKNSCIFLSMPA